MRPFPLAVAALGCGALAACGGGASSTGGTPGTGPGRGVEFTLQPADTTAGAPFAATVRVTDGQGAAVSGETVTVTLHAGPAGAALAGTTTRTTGADGTAAFTDLRLTRAATGYALTATTASGHADSDAFTVTHAAADATASDLTVFHAVVDADGVDSSRVTATLRDAHGNLAPGTAVGFSAPSATVVSSTAVSDGAGQAWATIASGTAGTATVTARFGAASRQADVRFIPHRETWVTGYYVGYQRDLYPPANVDFSTMTHLAVGAVLPRADGNLDTQFYVGPADGPAMARTLATRAHAAGRRALLMIGGDMGDGGATFRSAASDAHRAAFVHNLEAARIDLGYDGYDLDWEPLVEADATNLVSLATELRAAARATDPDLAVTITVPIGWYNTNYPVPTWMGRLGGAFDQLNFMSYGMSGPWDGWLSWHSAALLGSAGNHPSSIASTAEMYASVGIPAAKIGIGIGFYGSCWQGVTGPLQPTAGASIVASDNEMSYARIMAHYYDRSAYRWDDAAKMGYLSFASRTGPAQCNWVSYEDAASIMAKGDWVRANGYGGAIVWTVQQGATTTSTNPALDAMKAAFRP